MALISISVARHQLMLEDHGYDATVSRGVPLYASAFSSTKLYIILVGDRGTRVYNLHSHHEAAPTGFNLATS